MSEQLETLSQYLKNHKCAGLMKPYAVYHPIGDFIVVYWEDVRGVEECHNGFSLLRADDGRVVGCKIGYGISPVIELAKRENKPQEF